MKALTTELFRQHFDRYLAAVAQEGETIIVTRGDEEGTGVVVMSLAEYSQRLSHDHNFLYGTSANAAATERSLADAAAGRVRIVNFEDLERMVGIDEVLDTDTGAKP